MNMRTTWLLISIFLLLSCQTGPAPRHLSRGDIISLNKTITFPELSSHIVLQSGEVIDDRDLKAYQTSCIVDNDDLGPKKIHPQNYTVRKVTYNEEMYSDAAALIRYFTEFYLRSDDQRQNLILTCQTLDATMQHHNFPVDEVKLATGDYFRFQ